MTDNIQIAIFTFVGCFIVVPVVQGLLHTLGLFTIVGEREAKVYTFMGKVIGTLDTPGPHCPLAELGWQAPFCRSYSVDTRLDQEYVRSQPVNSEEGAPMGIGVWYEMYITDPESYLFKNTDPRGSLRANVSNATVRCLSNMKLANMLENRHEMSRTVRVEVSPKSYEWGYLLGSIYIRKVHFRDVGMIRQIEEKVVNRLRQVTSAIRQDGANQVSFITSTADREASVEFARAAATRPQLVGAALQSIIGQDPEVATAMFDILEMQKICGGEAEVTLIPSSERGRDLTPFLVAPTGPTTAMNAATTADLLARPAVQNPSKARPPQG